jgi:hypothetical protein
MSGVAQAVREDFLDEDPEIPGQKFALLSFISPENVLQRKDQFLFQKFLTDYEVEYKVKGLEQFLGSTVLDLNRAIDAAADAIDRAGDGEAAETIRKKRVAVDAVMDQYQTFIKKNKKEVTRTSIEEAYKDFLFRRQTKLEEEFHAANDFQTTIRGLKVRGVYSTTQEASVRAKKLMRTDPVHNILVGEIGKWLPWDPSPNAIQDQEYAEEQLNSLMQNYKKNEEDVDNFYRENKLKRPSKQVFGSAEGVSIEEARGLDNGVTDAAVDRSGERKPEGERKAVIVEPIDNIESANSIIGPGAVPAEQKAMFDVVGDLALQRKMDAATKKKD